jgi:hypothetical protein
VLIAWQHQDIPGISQSILTQTRTPLGTFNIPRSIISRSAQVRGSPVPLLSRRAQSVMISVVSGP